MNLSRRQFSSLLLTGVAGLQASRAQETPITPHRRLDLKIGNDFKASDADVRAVLTSAAEAIWKHCPNTFWQVPGFFLFHSEDSPITLFDHRADGRIAIGVTTQGNLWSQFAFQFAHEFCHALAGHSNDWRKLWIKAPKANHWLEESLCETASLFAMRSMAESWKTAAPYPNWTSYAKSLGKYAQDRLDATAVELPAGTRFPSWFRENEAAMREKSTVRAKNCVVAAQLLPIFEAEPSGWESLASMNLARRVADKSLTAHFTDWIGVAPPGQRGFIRKLAVPFGISV